MNEVRKNADQKSQHLECRYKASDFEGLRLGQKIPDRRSMPLSARHPTHTTFIQCVCDFRQAYGARLSDGREYRQHANSELASCPRLCSLISVIRRLSQSEAYLSERRLDQGQMRSEAPLSDCLIHPGGGTSR